MENLKIDKTLYNTKPENENRLEKEIATYDILENLNIKYTRIDHDATATIEDCNDVE